jgi:hypothetical protein
MEILRIHTHEHLDIAFDLPKRDLEMVWQEGSTQALVKGASGGAHGVDHVGSVVEVVEKVV